MALSNTQYTQSLQENVGDNNPDGIMLGATSTNRIGHFGATPVPERNDGRGSITPATTSAELITFAANSGAISATAANTAANQTFTATGVLAADFILGVCANASVANVGMSSTFIPTANTVDAHFFCTGATATAAANGAWTATIARGFNIAYTNQWAANGTTSNQAAAVVYKTASEQILQLGGTGASITANVNANGGLDYLYVANQGAAVTSGYGGYAVPPTITITDSLGVGFGATAKAQVSNGFIISVVLTNKGQGYTANYVNVTVTPGTVVAPGMVVAVQESAHQANLVIGECRVIGNNQIAVKMGAVGSANVTPTANIAYRVLAVSEMGAIGAPVRIQANVANFANSGAGAIGVRTVAVTGVASGVGGDQATYGAPVANATVVFGIPNITAANTIQLQYGGVANTLPANGVVTIGVVQTSQAAPVQIFSVPITGISSVAANVSGEQVFNLPSNMVIQANATIVINPTQALPNNLMIGGVRANSTGNVAINFTNFSGTAIAPANQNMLVAVFNSLIPVIGANLVEGYAATKVGPVGKMQEQLNEVQQTLAQSGFITG